MPAVPKYLLALARSSRPLVSTHASEARVALIIGNAAYSKAPLKNFVNEARALAQNLRSLGFDVMLLEMRGTNRRRRRSRSFPGR